MPEDLEGALTHESPTSAAVVELSSGGAGGWATRSGHDGSGAWAVLELGATSLRLRWIPPGSFRMGPRAWEPGRWGFELPQHDVELTHGFWMAEVPCTQEAWRAVVSEHASSHPGPSRPVENVSWELCQRFPSRLSGRVTGLRFRLPTEAEWELARRAGRTAASYAGADLPKAAWYGLDSRGRTRWARSRSACRLAYAPSYPNRDVGFRIAATTCDRPWRTAAIRKGEPCRAPAHVAPSAIGFGEPPQPRRRTCARLRPDVE